MMYRVQVNLQGHKAGDTIQADPEWAEKYVRNGYMVQLWADPVPIIRAKDVKEEVKHEGCAEDCPEDCGDDCPEDCCPEELEDGELRD